MGFAESKEVSGFAFDEISFFSSSVLALTFFGCDLIFMMALKGGRVEAFLFPVVFCSYIRYKKQPMWWFRMLSLNSSVNHMSNKRSSLKQQRCSLCWLLAVVVVEVQLLEGLLIVLQLLPKKMKTNNPRVDPALLHMFNVSFFFSSLTRNLITWKLRSCSSSSSANLRSYCFLDYLKNKNAK